MSSKEDLSAGNLFDRLPMKLSLQEVARLLSVSIQTINRLVTAGEIAVISGRVSRESFLDFVERNFLMNMPIFTVQENLDAYLKKHGSLPEFVDRATIEFILNEVPEALVKLPGYNEGIPRDQFLAYLNRSV